MIVKLINAQWSYVQWSYPQLISISLLAPFANRLLVGKEIKLNASCWKMITLSPFHMMINYSVGCHKMIPLKCKKKDLMFLMPAVCKWRHKRHDVSERGWWSCFTSWRRSCLLAQQHNVFLCVWDQQSQSHVHFSTCKSAGRSVRRVIWTKCDYNSDLCRSLRGGVAVVRGLGRRTRGRAESQCSRTKQIYGQVNPQPGKVT